MHSAFSAAGIALFCLLISPFFAAKWLNDRYRWLRRHAVYGGDEAARYKYDDLDY
jgi:hypothetical protein